MAIGIARAAEISGERDDRQEQLLPFQPAFLDLAEHVAADRAIHGAVHGLSFSSSIGKYDRMICFSGSFFGAFSKV